MPPWPLSTSCVSPWKTTEMANPLRSSLSRRPLLTAVVYTGSGILPLFLVSAQVLQLEADLGFDATSVGLAAAAFFGASALAANPAGTAIRRMSPGFGLRAGASLTMACSFIAALAMTNWMILLAMAIAGIGNAFTQVSANLAIFDGVSRRRQGLAFGAKQAAVPLASVLAGISLPAIALVFGWQWGFGGAALLALGLAISAPEPRTRSGETREEKPMGRPPASLPVLVAAGFFGAAAGNGISLFVVPSAVDVGIGEATAGLVLAVCSVLVVVARLAAGWTVDRRASSGHVEMAILTASGAAGALALMSTTSSTAYLLAMPVALLGAWSWPGVFFFTVIHSYPDFPARASGVALSGNLTGTVIGPLLVGALVGSGRYPVAWLCVAIAAALATLGFLGSYLVTRRRLTVSP